MVTSADGSSEAVRQQSFDSKFDSNGVNPFKGLCVLFSANTPLQKKETL